MKRAFLPLALALLTVPTCASLPQYAATDGTFVVGRELPPFPTWAPSSRGPVPVLLVKGLRCNDIPAFGCFIYASRTIAIEESLPHVLRWRYLRHELVHLAVENAGLNAERRVDNKVGEQDIAEAMADQQMAEMLSGWPR
jgi:hypothetical protein